MATVQRVPHESASRQIRQVADASKREKSTIIVVQYHCKQHTSRSKETLRMKYGKVPGIDKQITHIVHGTIMATSKDLDKSFAVLDSAFEHGINTFDTGHVYGSGDNE